MLYRALEGEISVHGDEVHVAVSGGIDSWVLAALLKRAGCRVRGWYLESGVEGYCEREQVLRFREEVGIPCEHIRVTGADFVESAAEFVAVTETPIYNLHPVSKLLLAKGLARNGVTSVVTGDGADQVMRHDWDCDLLPLTLTCFRSAGVQVVAPFLSETVVGLCGQRHSDKEPIRELARRLGVPVVAKCPTLSPDVSLPGQEQVWRPVLPGTTELLLQAMEKRETCAASVG
jgi:PP-loop superfamily ATP-utilizing enzyme